MQQKLSFILHAHEVVERSVNKQILEIYKKLQSREKKSNLLIGSDYETLMNSHPKFGTIFFKEILIGLKDLKALPKAGY